MQFRACVRYPSGGLRTPSIAALENSREISSIFPALTVKGSHMTLIESVKTCFFKYADFSGEASRSELWWFTLFTLLTIIGAALISPTLGLIVILGLLIPNISVTTRRLHDLGHSGWWQLIFVLPGLGYLILSLYLMRKGVTDGEYEY